MAEQYACEQCGATLAFAPGTNSIKCDHCGFENAIPDSDETVDEIDFRATLANLESGEETVEDETLKCETCAAEFTFEKDVHSGECPFCGTRVVTEPRKNKHLKPKSLIPFVIERKGAREKIQGWLGSRWFAPNDLKRRAQTDSLINGIYTPYWTYDAHTESDYRGERGTAYQVPVTTRDAKGNVRTTYRTEIRWSPAAGHVARTFDDVLVVASHTLPKKYADRLRTWQLDALTPYNQSYVAGFRSEMYQVGLEEGFREAKARMDAQIRRDVRHDIGGDAQRIHWVRTDYQNITFKHVLLPVWITAFRYGGKSYQILVNGQTGEVQGARPWSWIKISLAVLAVVVVVGGAIYFFSQRDNGGNSNNGSYQQQQVPIQK